MSQPPTPVVRKLIPEDDRARFRSGNLELDRFFQLYAGQNQFKHHLGTTYVAIAGDGIAGFATVAPSEIAPGSLPARRGKLPGYPLPVLRLARLAVDERARGRGVGIALLRAVFFLARRLGVDFGCVGIVVDAKPEALSFYEHYGFIARDVVAGQLGDRPEPRTLFLPMGSIPADDGRDVGGMC